MALWICSAATSISEREDSRHLLNIIPNKEKEGEPLDKQQPTFTKKVSPLPLKGFKKQYTLNCDQ